MTIVMAEKERTWTMMIASISASMSGKTATRAVHLERDVEALEWAAEGHTIADIARHMRISPETVKGHLDSARYKLQALNKVHAVSKAIRVPD